MPIWKEHPTFRIILLHPGSGSTKSKKSDPEDGRSKVHKNVCEYFNGHVVISKTTGFFIKTDAVRTSDTTLKTFFVALRQKRNFFTLKIPRTLNQRPIKSHAYMQRKRNRVLHNITWLQGGRSRKCASIPVESKKFNSSPKHPERLWGPSGLLCNGHRGAFPRVKRRGVKLTRHILIMKRLKVSAGIPRWNAHGQLLTTFTCVTKHYKSKRLSSATTDSKLLCILWHSWSTRVHYWYTWVVPCI